MLQDGWQRPSLAARVGLELASCGVPGYVIARTMTDRGRMQRFEGTDSYVATQDLQVAVNAAIALERPLLVKGEPGTGKTILAHEVARGIGKDLITWHIKSTTKAQQGLYEYDAVSRLRDGQLGDERVHDIANYIVPGKLWDAFDGRRSAGLADRRDRQGRHRISQRPAARTRSHGVLCLRDPANDPRPAAPDRDHHLEQRKRVARRLSCAAAFFTTSASPTARRCKRSSMCIFPI